MPTRYLKQGICDSKHIDKLTPESEVFYYRLLVNVDDFGRFDARLLILRSNLFPLKDYTTKQIEKWLIELAESNLISVYKHNDDNYLQMLKWDNKPRASESKFPANTDECIQLYTSVPLTETVNRNRNRKPITETVNRATSNEVTNIFEFWKNKLNHNRAKLDDKRENAIKKALKIGYSTQDLIDAIYGCSLSDFHMGVNDKSTKYDSIDLIFRDADQIDKFIGIFTQGGAKAGKDAELDSISQRAIDDFVGNSNTIKGEVIYD